MADFCRQCKRDMGFDDDSDYQSGRPAPKPGEGYPQICEGCGYIYVDHLGNRVATRAEGCLKGHGGYREGKEVPAGQNARSAYPVVMQSVPLSPADVEFFQIAAVVLIGFLACCVVIIYAR